jgi:hypothetical protein
MDLKIKSTNPEESSDERRAAYLELLRILTGGSPCLQVSRGLKEFLESRGHREFEIERIK